MDIFLEQMIKKRKDRRDYLIIASIVLGGILLSALSLIFAQYLLSFWYVPVAVIWYFAYVLISRRSVEYEYSFTNGELDVDVIYAKKRRVHKLSIKVRDLSVCANIADENSVNQYMDVKGLKLQYDMTSSKYSRNIYFADFRQNGDKARLLFEPSNKMLEGMKKYNSRVVTPSAE